MKQEERRIYQIPRKVDASLRLFGLNIQGILIMAIPIVITIFIWQYTNLPFPGKIAISIILIYGSYLMLTEDFGGYTGFQYIWLLLQHMTSQKTYSLTTSNQYHKFDEKPLIILQRKKGKTNGSGSETN